MSKRKSRNFETVAPRKKSNIIGTISGMDVLLRRKGRVILALNPEIASHVHGSKKDYDKKREKEWVRALKKEF